MGKNILPFRNTVLGIFLKDNGQILSIFSERNNSHKNQVVDSHNWKLPQGGIEKGETILKAFKREMLEELNIKIKTENILIKKIWNKNFSYFFINKNKEPVFEIRLHPILYKVDKNISIYLDEKENNKYKWLTINDFLRLNTSIRKIAYENIIQDLLTQNPSQFFS